MRIIKGIRINGKLVPDYEVNRMLAKLKEYEESELSPEEVHIMSERLTEFEKAGLEPGEVIKLAKKDEVAAVTVDKYKLMWCPSCKALIGAMHDKTKESFCRECGQRVTALNAVDVE